MAPILAEPTIPMTSLRAPASLAVLTLLLLTSACASDPNRRTPGVVIDDFALENIVESEIRKSDPGYKGSHIVVVSHNGVVLLAGQVGQEIVAVKVHAVAAADRSHVAGLEPLLDVVCARRGEQGWPASQLQAC